MTVPDERLADVREYIAELQDEDATLSPETAAATEEGLEDTQRSHDLTGGLPAHARHRRTRDGNRELRILLGWAFRPRNFMKNWHHGSGGSGKVVGTVEKSRPRYCLIRSMRALRE
jgi:hypothetical protein